jgi:hypothetical protein
MNYQQLYNHFITRCNESFADAQGADKVYEDMAMGCVFAFQEAADLIANTNSFITRRPTMYELSKQEPADNSAYYAEVENEYKPAI